MLVRRRLMSAESRLIRVVLADDECLFRTSLRQLLDVPTEVIRDVYGTEVGAGFEVVGEASSGEETVRAVAAVRPDLLLLDLNMPRLSGLDAFKEIAQASPVPRTILLTGEISSRDVLSAVRLGVDGLVVKQAATELLFEAIVAVLAGRCWVDQALVSDLVDCTRSLLEARAAAGRRPVQLAGGPDILPLASQGLDRSLSGDRRTVTIR